MPKKAVIVGSTGLIGKQLLNKLLSSAAYEKVYAISRRELDRKHAKFETVIAEYETLPQNHDCWTSDDVFCCLGTTMKQAGSKEAFRKIDYDYPVKMAEYAKAGGAKSYHLITAMGADSGSMFFYNRVKGEVENKITQFDFNSFHIYRPSLLYGDRKDKRAGEKIAIGLSKALEFLLVGPLRKYKGIKSSKVAQSMITNAQLDESGMFIHESDQMQGYKV